VKCKAAWLDAAEVFDTWRIVPRIVLAVYGVWMIRLTDWMVKWYENLPSSERTVQVTAFVTVVLPGVYGIGAWVYRIYSDGGRDWTGQTMVSSSTVSSTTVSK
jgi:hypothetical protein